MFFNLLVIKNSGFNKRYIFDKINLDMSFYAEDLGKFRKKNNPLKFNTDKTKILIVGDSHAHNIFDAFISNKSFIFWIWIFF